MSSFTLDQTGLLIRARYTLLFLVTHEERRVEVHLLATGRKERFEVFRWRSSLGLIGPDGEVAEGTRAPEAALGFLLGVPSPAMFVMHDFHLELRRPEVVRLLRDLEPVLAARTQAVVMVGPVPLVPVELEKDLTVLDVPLPDPGELGEMVDDVAARDGIFLDPDSRQSIVRACLGLTASEAQRALTRVRALGGMLTEEDVPSITEEKRRAIRKSRYLEFLDTIEPIGDVGGMENLKGWLRQRALAFTDEARQFGLPTPKGLFLLGVQGCGKSMMAKAVGSLWRVPLLRLDVAAVFESAAERAEQGLRDTMRVAESLAPVVLWIDELEKGFLATRDEGGGRALGTFLTWMQEKTRPVFVVATANDVRMLPPELLRKGRFDEIFFVDLPNVHERLAILEVHLRRRGRDAERFDLTAIAEETERFSGAELEQVVVAALFKAFAEHRDLRDDDLMENAREMVPLAVTMDDHLKNLREWARPRARLASFDTRRVDYFEEWEEAAPS